jgi:microcystin degradation protein MlrC
VAFGWHLGGTLNAGSQGRGMEAGRSGRSEHLNILENRGRRGRAIVVADPWDAAGHGKKEKVWCPFRGASQRGFRIW